MPPASARTARAFSLIELLIVIGIIALVAGIAVPRFAAADAQRRTQLAAAKFKADLELLRTGARVSGEPRALALSPEGDRYLLQDADGVLRSIDLTRPPFSLDSTTFTLDGGGTSLVAGADGLLNKGGTVRFRADGSYCDLTLPAVRAASVDDPETLLNVGLDDGLSIELLGIGIHIGGGGG